MRATFLDGQPVDDRRPRDARGLGISTIYQELNLVPHLSVAENIFLGEAPTRLARRRRLARAERADAELLAISA